MARRSPPSPALSLEGKLALVVGGVAVGSVAVASALWSVDVPAWLRMLAAVAVVLPVSLLALRSVTGPINRLLQALNDGVASLTESDFSISIAGERDDELGELVELYNSVGRVLREERQSLFQRELLLDTVIQSTPIALILCSASGHVIYSNTASRRLLWSGRKLEGHTLQNVLTRAPAGLREAVESGRDGLVTVEGDDEQEFFHLSQRSFLLNTRTHRLILVKRLTRELNRQEVATWKKVIRVISHELNNSLAPIASLAHSGQLISGRSDEERLRTVFSTIEERAAHLKRFLEGYARFAKLPQPQLEEVEWRRFVHRLEQTAPFELRGPLPEGTARFDPAQLEQVLINLLQNAREAGSPVEEIGLAVEPRNGGAEITVVDRGSGMSDAVLRNALLPFYSTKQTGTGLGLPLCREIVEAHGGRLSLRNRTGGGLEVSIWLQT